jgi:hypothetical protein
VTVFVTNMTLSTSPTVSIVDYGIAMEIGRKRPPR